MKTADHTALDTHALLLEISQGSESAFSILMQRYWQNIYLHVLSYLKKATVAEEITQDIFIQVWKKKDMLVNIDNFESYLYVMARNRTLTELRKKLRTESINSNDDLPSEWMSPEGELTYKEMYNTLIKGIDSMPNRRREIFRMSRIEGYSHIEIAEKLGISKHTVNEHIGDALNYLRTWLRNHSDDSFLLTAIFMMILYEA